LAREYSLSKKVVTEPPCIVWRRENLLPLPRMAIPFFYKTFKIPALTTAAVMRKNVYFTAPVCT